MSELTRRILFAVPAAVVFLYLTWLGGAGFYLLLFFIAFLAAMETARMVHRMGTGVHTPLALTLGVLIWAQELLPVPLLLLPLLLAAVFGVLVWRTESEERMVRWSATLFAGFYAPAGLLFFWKVRHADNPETGFWVALTLLLMIWANDIAAYLGGRKFGKRPLAPSISPKKTREGFWFGMGGATAVLIVLLLYGVLPFGWLAALPLIPIVGCAGPAGDLIESRLKRLADMKDSSGLLPGHGGMMDRFDSLIFTAPLFYIYVIWVLA